MNRWTGTRRAHVRGTGSPRAGREGPAPGGGRRARDRSALRSSTSSAGDQPIFNEDRTVIVVLNGEIYNFRELRRRAERQRPSPRHRTPTPRSSSHLYEEFGRGLRPASCAGCSPSRCGTAAPAQLLLARDRVGKKPLFYAQRGGAVSFASELAALMQDPEVPREIDHQALDAFLAYGCVPAPLSAFAGVRKLMPATRSLPRATDPTERYWRRTMPQATRAAGGGAVRGDPRRRSGDRRRRMRATFPSGPSSRAGSTPPRSSRRWPRQLAQAR